jgi:hypothetical protein
MSADQQRIVSALADREPLVAGLVDLLVRTGALELHPQPRARGLPRVRPRDALGAVLVAGQLAQLPKLLDAT